MTRSRKVLKVIRSNSTALMASNDPRDKQPIGEAGLWLVCDRTPSRQWESHPRREPKPARERWESHPRREPKPARERLDPVRSGKTRAKKWPKTEAKE